MIGKHKLIHDAEQIYLFFGDAYGNLVRALCEKITANERGKYILEQLSTNSKYNLTRDEFVSRMSKNDELTRILITNTLAFVRLNDESRNVPNQSSLSYQLSVSY